MVDYPHSGTAFIDGAPQSAKNLLPTFDNRNRVHPCMRRFGGDFEREGATAAISYSGAPRRRRRDAGEHARIVRMVVETWSDARIRSSRDQGRHNRLLP